eukprot:TRINITY_DN1165_c0_g1_i7.p2 TRINITY_DN1165_c0_g1~~TRINITY_DN1165_c0_g1_i7.p2  ORF type:complete len:225 (+),score=76.86 TRINITY_DN1165_c0_g1_i7:205-879(+)
MGFTAVTAAAAALLLTAATTPASAIVRSFNDKSNNAIRATYPPSAFKFTPFQSDNTLSLPIGNLTVGTVDSDPVLGAPDIQLSYVAVKLNGGATLPAHTHPRAAEMDYMIYGVLKNSFVEEFGSARPKVDVVLNAGEIGVIPEGLMHAQTCMAHEGCFSLRCSTRPPGDAAGAEHHLHARRDAGGHVARQWQVAGGGDRVLPGRRLLSNRRGVWGGGRAGIGPV